MDAYTKIKQLPGKAKQKEKILFLLNTCHLNLLSTFTTVGQIRNNRDTKCRYPKFSSDLCDMLIKYSSSTLLCRHLEIKQSYLCQIESY